MLKSVFDYVGLAILLVVFGIIVYLQGRSARTLFDFSTPFRERTRRLNRQANYGLIVLAIAVLIWIVATIVDR